MSRMHSMSRLWALISGRAVIVETEEHGLPKLCRELMCFGTRLCEMPEGHTGHHYCKAVHNGP